MAGVFFIRLYRAFLQCEGSVIESPCPRNIRYLLLGMLLNDLSDSEKLPG
jgi:hypothetical protein